MAADVCLIIVGKRGICRPGSGFPAGFGIAVIVFLPMDRPVVIKPDEQPGVLMGVPHGSIAVVAAIDLDNADNDFIRRCPLNYLAGVPVIHPATPLSGLHDKLSAAAGTGPLGVILYAGECDFVAAAGADAFRGLLPFLIIIEEIGGQRRPVCPGLPAAGQSGEAGHPGLRGYFRLRFLRHHWAEP